MRNPTSGFGQAHSHKAMSSEDFLRKHVFNVKRSSKQQYKSGQPVTMEEFIKYDVFGASLPESETRRATVSLKNTGRPHLKNNQERAERMVFTHSIPPQSGPEDGAGAMRDFTPDNLPAYEKKSFVTPQGVPFGEMELIRDNLGRIIRRGVTCGGASHVHEYGYDQAGRLIMVNKKHHQ